MNPRTRGGWEARHCFCEIEVSLSYTVLCWLERPGRGRQPFNFVHVKGSFSDWAFIYYSAMYQDLDLVLNYKEIKTLLAFRGKTRYVVTNESNKGGLHKALWDCRGLNTMLSLPRGITEGGLLCGGNLLK